MEKITAGLIQCYKTSIWFTLLPHVGRRYIKTSPMLLFWNEDPGSAPWELLILVSYIILCKHMQRNEELLETLTDCSEQLSQTSCSGRVANSPREVTWSSSSGLRLLDPRAKVLYIISSKHLLRAASPDFLLGIMYWMSHCKVIGLPSSGQRLLIPRVMCKAIHMIHIAP